MEKEERNEKTVELEEAAAETAETEKKEASKTDVEFLKGTLFGILLAGVFGMAVFLTINGTWGASRKQEEGCGVLASQATFDKLEEIANRISSSFLYEADGELLETYLFKGLILGLEDSYAAYYTKDEIEEIAQLNEGEYYGIGITLGLDTTTGLFEVKGIYEGSPAWNAGLQEGDILLKVGETVVEGMELSAVVALVKQEPETLLTIQRDGKEEEISVELTSVEIPTVSFEMLEKQAGYLKITEFDQITVKQFEDAVEELKEQQVEALIIDLRDNPGGTLDSVCEILDDLLPEGLIVATEDKEGNRKEYTSGKSQIYDGPLAVLVNENSASASEIFAGAIQDYKLGPVIGTVTYGKGVVQHTYLLNDGSALKLTVEEYYTAAGQEINGNGITPDIQIEETEDKEADENADENAEAKDGVQDPWIARALEAITND